MLFFDVGLCVLDFLLFLASYSLMVVLLFSCFWFSLTLLIAFLGLFFSLRMICTLVLSFLDCSDCLFVVFIGMVFEIVEMLLACGLLIELLVQVLTQIFLVLLRTCFVPDTIIYLL